MTRQKQIKLLVFLDNLRPSKRVWIFGGVLATLGFAALSLPARASEQPSDPPALLLVEPEHIPHVTISWPRADGSRITVERDQPFASPNDRDPIGPNLEAFVALGGKRLAKGAGHPKGAIVRVGFYKVRNSGPLFEGIDPDGAVTIRLQGVVFNQPVAINHDSPLHHFMFDHEQIMARGLPMKAMDVFNMLSPTDTLNQRITPDVDARLGVLDGSALSDGSVRINREADGSLTMTATIPYRLFRHIKPTDPAPDPNTHAAMGEGSTGNSPGTMQGMGNMGQMGGMDHGSMAHTPSSTTDQIGPGGFLEPFHFHLEYEAVPESIADELDTWPPRLDPRPSDPETDRE